MVDLDSSVLIVSSILRMLIGLIGHLPLATVLIRHFRTIQSTAEKLDFIIGC